MKMLNRLHIVGCPRSGTTLLLELVANCFEVDERSQFEFSIFKTFDTTSGVVVSKQPTDIVHLQPLMASDPHLHVIHIIRDPRAVVASKHTAIKGYFSNYRIWKECELASRRLLGHPRFLQIHYEDLATDPDNIQQRILQAFPFLQSKHRFSEFADYATPGKAATEALNGLRAVDSASIRKWHQHLSRVKAQLLRFPALQDDLEYYGYENDARWQLMLAGVVPQQFPCRYCDSAEYLKNWEKRLRVYLKTRRYLRRLRA